MDATGTGSSVKVDLANCEQEPIRVPGAIQPHGVLFALHEEELSILRVSANTQAQLGVGAALLLGKKVVELLSPTQRNELVGVLRSADLPHKNPFKLTLETGGQQRIFDAIAHRHEGQLILELEPVNERDQMPASPVLERGA